MMKTMSRRRTSSSAASGFMFSRLPGSPEESNRVLVKPRFQLHLWLGLVLHSWILDVGRPVVMLLVPSDLFPLNRPGAADCLHFLYNVTAPLVLLKVLERSPRTPPPVAVRLGLVSVVMATGFHLVADSVARRLLLIGYELHLSVRENEVMRKLEPPALVDAFELLFYYDHTLGHLMWFVPFFLVLLLFFSGSFCSSSEEVRLPPAAWLLLAPNSAYYWYLIAEGQTFILFTFTFFAMAATVMHQRRRGLVPDGNGLFMLYSFSLALLLLLLWVVCLWDDGVLRRKHPGLIYVPQPRAVYTLHLHRRQLTHT